VTPPRRGSGQAFQACDQDQDRQDHTDLMPEPGQLAGAHGPVTVCPSGLPLRIMAGLLTRLAAEPSAHLEASMTAR
jgi:hypothetical protein